MATIKRQLRIGQPTNTGLLSAGRWRRTKITYEDEPVVQASVEPIHLIFDISIRDLVVNLTVVGLLAEDLGLGGVVGIGILSVRLRAYTEACSSSTSSTRLVWHSLEGEFTDGSGKRWRRSES